MWYGPICKAFDSLLSGPDTVDSLDLGQEACGRRERPERNLEGQPACREVFHPLRRPTLTWVYVGLGAATNGAGHDPGGCVQRCNNGHALEKVCC